MSSVPRRQTLGMSSDASSGFKPSRLAGWGRGCFCPRCCVAAHSPALLAFGGDSAIELLSAVVVYWRFQSKRSDEQTEKLAARITGSLLFALAAYVALVAALALLGHREVRPSYLGIVVLIVAAIAMPVLARQKRQLSALTASAALRADAAESALCGYLSIIALAGLVANAFWGVTWADPIAALLPDTAGCAGRLASS